LKNSNPAADGQGELVWPKTSQIKRRFVYYQVVIFESI
jgi:hypothetical protein